MAQVQNKKAASAGKGQSKLKPIRNLHRGERVRGEGTTSAKKINSRGKPIKEKKTGK